MQIRDVMTPDPTTISPATPMQQAAEHMRDGDFGAIAVCDGRRIQGVVTDRDIAVRGVAEGRDPATAVAEIMSPDVHWLYDDQDASDAAELMQREQVRRVFVVDRDKNLVGVVATADVAKERPNDEVAETIEDISR